jgi:hypothetical protein
VIRATPRKRNRTGIELLGDKETEALATERWKFRSSSASNKDHDKLVRALTLMPKPAAELGVQMALPPAEASTRMHCSGTLYVQRWDLFVATFALLWHVEPLGADSSAFVLSAVLPDVLRTNRGAAADTDSSLHTCMCTVLR